MKHLLQTVTGFAARALVRPGLRGGQCYPASQTAMRRYGVAALAWLSALGVRAALDPILAHNVPYMPFAVAVMIAGRFAGRGPALLNTVLCTLSAEWFFLEPRYSFSIASPAAAASLVLFAVVGVGISMFSSGLRRSMLELADTAAALRQQAQLIDLSHDAIITADAQRIITGWNRGAVELYGWTEAHAIGKPICDLLQTSGVSLSAIDRILDRDGRWDGQLEHIARDGRCIAIESRQVLVRDQDGAPAGILEINRDVTERTRQAEELSRTKEAAELANRAKSQFLASMSHEIRTPMNGVMGMTDLLLATVLTPEQREYADTVRSCAGSLLTVLDDILDFSKIEADKLAIERVHLDLHALFRQVVAIISPLANEKGLQLTLSVDDGVPASVTGDPVRLRQVVMNLLTNAVKFTAQGFVALRVTTTRQDHEGATLRIEVQDTGPGLSPEVQERLFQPFTQGDASTTRRFGGSGLGLAISKRLITLMGGTIGVDSTVGTGSVFWFTITLPVSEASTIAAASSFPVSQRTGLRVLVVEDNAVNQRVACRMLEKLGCRVDSAGDGQLALSRLAQNSYDVVLMDCHMPGMDGYEATRELRRREAGCPRTPVIALTAGAFAEDRERAIAAGMDDYLSKPVQLAEIARMLQKFAPTDSRLTGPMTGNGRHDPPVPGHEEPVGAGASSTNQSS